VTVSLQMKLEGPSVLDSKTRPMSVERCWRRNYTYSYKIKGGVWKPAKLFKASNKNIKTGPKWQS